MPSVNMPSRRGGAMERLAAGLGIANSIFGIKNSIDQGNAQAADREKAAKLDDPNSQESKQQYDALSKLVPGAPQGLNAKQYASMTDEAFKNQIKSSSNEYALSQKDVAGLVKDGARLVPPGSQGAQTFAAIGADGKAQQIGLVPPVKEKSKAELEIIAGKQLPADKVLLVNQGNEMPKLLAGIRNTIESNASEFGPIAGRMGGMNPYNRSATAIQSQMKTAAQMVGKFMEDGVLRKEDEEKYEKMLPSLNDTPESAADKLAIVENMLSEKQRSNVEALKMSGYDTKGVQKNLTVPGMPGILAGKKKSDNLGQAGNAVASGGLSEKALMAFTQEDASAYAEAQRRLKANPKDETAMKAIRILESRGQ